MEVLTRYVPRQQCQFESKNRSVKSLGYSLESDNQKAQKNCEELSHGQTTSLKTACQGVGELQRIVRRFVRSTIAGARRYWQVVGEGYCCACHHLGGGSAEVFAAHPRGKAAAAVQPPIRWHRRVQCIDDRA